MWKSTSRTLYTPPAYIHREPSPNIYSAKAPNTVENITGLPFVQRTLARIKFIPITTFIYKDLLVNTYPKSIYRVSQYPRIDITDLNPLDSFTYQDSLYQSASIDNIYVNMDTDEDQYLTIAYEVKNITTYKNIAIFTAVPELSQIFLQTDSSTPPQRITLDFLKQAPLTKETIVTFLYDYEIYNGYTKQPVSVLNNLVNIQQIPMLVFSHSFDNYDEIDLLLYKDRSYKRMYGLDSVDELFDTKTHHGFIMNKDYASIILN